MFFAQKNRPKDLNDYFGTMVIAPASGTEDGGFESRPGVKF
jgi:hypothetical protein